MPFFFSLISKTMPTSFAEKEASMQQPVTEVLCWNTNYQGKNEM